MRLTVDVPKSLVVRMRRTPVMLMQPEMTSAAHLDVARHGLAGKGGCVEL